MKSELLKNVFQVKPACLDQELASDPSFFDKKDLICN